MYLILCALISLTVLLLIAFLSVSDIEREVINTLLQYRYIVSFLFCLENTIPRDFSGDLPRFGHSAVFHNGTVYIYGGFNGQTKSDILTFTPGPCAHMKVSTSTAKASVSVLPCLPSAESLCWKEVEGLLYYDSSHDVVTDGLLIQYTSSCRIEND